MFEKLLSRFRMVAKNLRDPKESLKWKTIQSSIVVIGGDALKNILRLGGNLIMTRLLYPEAFGLMLIVALVQTALVMLSDAGVRDAVIVKSRGREEAFVNTAWVVMIIRGAGLLLITCLLAWPISLFYEQPILMWLIIISGLVPFIEGFSSPHRFIYERDIRQVEVAAVDLLSQSLMLLIGIAVLFVYPSIWVLAFFSVVGALGKCILSYKFFKGPLPRFKIDEQAFKEIFKIGKWIVLATALTFFANQGDKVFVSKLLTIEQLGVFSVAIVLAKVIETIASTAANKLLLPVYAAIDSQGKGKRDLNKKTRKIKFGFAALFVPPVLFLCVLGGWLIDFLYDDRYHDAGWMLQIMAAGTLFAAFTASLSPVIIGKGHVQVHLMLYVVKVLVYFSVLFLGNYYYGLVGIVMGIAIAPLIIYFVYSTYVMRYGIYAMKEDVPIFVIFIGIVASCWYYFGWPTVTMV